MRLARSGRRENLCRNEAMSGVERRESLRRNGNCDRKRYYDYKDGLMSKRHRKQRGALVPATLNVVNQPTIQGQPKTQAKSQTIWNSWKAFWAFVGPIIAITGFWFTMTPAITVEPSVNTDPAKIYATQIMITNRGHVPIYDLRFSCGIGAGGGRTTFNGLLSPPDIRPAERLGAGQPITRSCDVGTLDVEGNARLRFEVSYVWPIIGYHDSRQVIFDVKKGVPGYFLVPDVLP
jgi:hypothetical protein